ncbi:TetR/AcrR family transcriptional regulator [Actinomadura sp. DC4]|uniref:TetR/AcrR family transcriptional regulator n=1 Tax=Actinomadura sp. DC4 TaxID=3055069 RepID=UPI0025B030ED|nr:TetR/AcrR family transcriptional regulator [Actinomadura sp. DC4]MDN3351140.1 TetR/AcrR family transcriptional regulator [Actinomadura sp. DC4]
MPKVSEEHLRARREEILDGAARCFARAGFHRTTVQDIAAETGLSPGLVYRYFADKDDMVAAIATRWHEHNERRLHVDDPGTLDAMAGSYLALLRSIAEPGERERVRLSLQVWAEALRAPRIHAVAREGVDTPREVITELLRAAQARGEVSPAPPPDGLARVFVAIYQGLELQTAWDEGLDNEAYVRAVEALIVSLTR